MRDVDDEGAGVVPGGGQPAEGGHHRHLAVLEALMTTLAVLDLIKIATLLVLAEVMLIADNDKQQSMVSSIMINDSTYMCCCKDMQLPFTQLL